MQSGGCSVDHDKIILSASLVSKALLTKKERPFSALQLNQVNPWSQTLKLAFDLHAYPLHYFPNTHHFLCMHSSSVSETRLFYLIKVYT